MWSSRIGSDGRPTVPRTLSRRVGEFFGLTLASFHAALGPELHREATGSYPIWERAEGEESHHNPRRRNGMDASHLEGPRSWDRVRRGGPTRYQRHQSAQVEDMIFTGNRGVRMKHTVV